MLLDFILIGASVFGLAKLLSVTAFRKVPAAPWVAWMLTVAVVFVSFSALFLSKIYVYGALAPDASPKPNFILPLLFGWLFFVSLRRLRTSPPASTHSDVSDSEATAQPSLMRPS